MIPVPRHVLVRCFLRSLFLQAAWNVRGMQNVGFAFAIRPALRHLYPEPEALRAATTRHLQTFNTQPYMAEAILGGAIHHEVRVAAGEEPVERVALFKQALAGPLAALGDAFFWAGLRPAAGAVGAVLLVFFGLWALPLFLLLYNAVHLTARLYLFHHGYRLGDDVLAAVGSLRLNERATRLKLVAAAGVGLAVVAWTASQAVALGYSPFWVPALVVLGTAGLVALLRTGTNPYLAMTAAVGAGLLAGLAATWI